ncbi:hypothetical protein CD113_10910, partial [Staphylococcus simiae]
MSNKKKNNVGSRLDFMPNRLNKYSIRKFTVGTASILVGASLILGHQEAEAAETTQSESSPNTDSTNQSTDNTTSNVQSNNTTQATTSDTQNTTTKSPTSNTTASTVNEKVETTNKNDTKLNEDKKITNKDNVNTNNDISTTNNKAESPAQNKGTTEQDTANSSHDQHTDQNQQNDKKVNDSQKAQNKTVKTNQDDTNQQNTSGNNEPAQSTNDTTTKKEQYAANKVADLGVDKNVQTDVAQNVKSQNDISNLSKEQLDQIILATTIQKDLQNPNSKLGLDPFIALAATPASASTSTTPTPVSPKFKTRMFFATPTPSGTNVNDKVNFTNLTMTTTQGRTLNGNPDVWITSADNIIIKGNYQIDNTVKEGDYFTVKYGDYIRPGGGIDYLPGNVDLKSVDGDIVARGDYDKASNTIKYTFTNYVDQYKDIKGSFTSINSAKRENATTDKTVYPMAVTYGNQSVTNNIAVEYGNNKSDVLVSATSYSNNKQYNMVTYVNQPGSIHYNTKLTTDLNGFTLDKNNFKIYEVLDTSAMVDSFTPNYSDTSKLKDVTSSFASAITTNNDNTQATINFGNIAQNKRYIVSQVMTRTGNADSDKISYTLTGLDKNNRPESVKKVNSYSTSSGTSTANGTELTYEIGDYVWEDTNQDGIQNDGGKGIANVYVKLTDATTGTVIDRVTTDANGKYLFKNVPNGTYKIDFTAPSNYTASPVTAGSDTALDSNGQTTTVTVNNANNYTIDSGFFRNDQYKLGDYVWEDTNKNGIQDVNEKGIAGVSVALKDSKGQVIDQTTTDGDGKYLFTNLKNGTYTVTFQPPAGYKATLANQGTNNALDSNGLESTATINFADNNTIDSGFIKKDKYNVGDFVWNDSNKNGIQDAGEAGIGGVTVLLKNDQGRTIANTVTDRDGKYGFYDIEEGTYTIQFIEPDGYTLSPTNVGSNTNIDSNGPVVKLVLQNNDYSNDLGLYKNTAPSLDEYEITVEDVSYKNEVRENKSLPKNTIQLAQQGEDGRDRVFYKQLGYNPDLTGKDQSKLLQVNGYYFEEVRRDHLYTSKNAIFEYNLDDNAGVTNITYNPGNNTYTVTYNDGSTKELPGQQPKGLTIDNSYINNNGDTVVNFSDGSTITIPKGKDGVDGKPGVDGKTPTVEQTPITNDKGEQTGVTIVVKDGNGNVVSTQNVLNGKNGTDGKDGAKGEKGDKGDKGDTGANGKDGTNGVDGKDGKTPTVEQTPIKDAQGNTIGTTIIVKDGDGKEISRQNILNGKDGANGADGKDGKTPTVEQTPIKDAQGNTIGTTIIVKDGDGKEISRQDILNGKDGTDGKDGAKGEKGDKGDKGDTGANGKDGTNGVDGKDGKTPSVEQAPIKDAQGNTIGTTIIVKDGDGKEISRQDILNG